MWKLHAFASLPFFMLHFVLLLMIYWYRRTRLQFRFRVSQKKKTSFCFFRLCQNSFVPHMNGWMTSHHVFLCLFLTFSLCFVIRFIISIIFCLSLFSLSLSLPSFIFVCSAALTKYLFHRIGKIHRLLHTIATFRFCCKKIEGTCVCVCAFYLFRVLFYTLQLQ